MPEWDDFLSYLVCPEDRSPLHAADKGLVVRLNAALEAGRLTNRAGKLISRTMDGEFVHGDRTIAYPIVDAIPMLVIDEGIPLAQLEPAS